MSEDTTLEQKKRDVFLSRASSRKELASTLHDVILPELGRHANNLEVARKGLESLASLNTEAVKRIGEIEARPMLPVLSFRQRLRWLVMGSL